MVAAFGSGTRRKWPDRRLLENRSRLRCGGLLGLSEIVISYAGKSQTVQIEEERWEGKHAKLRPWFRCPNPSCGRRCRILVLHEDQFVCQQCSGADYTCRHRNRSRPALNRVARAPARMLARERAIAQVEIEAALRDMVRTLEKRSKRGKR